jgi:transcriptional regulator PpsR
VARRREINHLGGNADGIPVAYTAVRLGEHGPVLAVGRDLRAVAAIQQRFVDSQQELERGYWQARRAEARYRLLFQVATDAVLTVDALSLEIIEANPMAATMLAAAQPLAGQLLTAVFNGPTRGAVQALLTAARSSPRPLEIAARLDDGSGVGVAATPFRTDDTMRLLVRVRSAPETGSSRDVSLARLVDAHDEAIVVTDASGRVRLANPAFLRWVQAESEAALRGQAITQWIAPEALQRLIDTVQAQGVAEARGVQLRQAAAPDGALEMSAVLLTEGDQECIGITLRPRAAVAAALRQDGDMLPPLQLGLAALHDELGRQDLAQLLRRARALAEHSFVEAALQRSGGDAAAAAQLLGVAVARVLRHRRPPATSRDEAPPGAR